MLCFQKLAKEIIDLVPDEDVVKCMKAEILLSKIFDSEDPNDFNEYSSDDLINAFYDAEEYIRNRTTNKSNIINLLSKVKRVKKRRLL